MAWSDIEYPPGAVASAQRSALSGGRGRRRHAVGILIALVAVLIAIGALLIQRRHQAMALHTLPPPRPRAGELPVLFSAPRFTFRDQDGAAAGDQALRGHVWVADFIFTHCAGICPQVTAQMVRLQKAIDAPGVRFVSFSVDPDRDDPQTLKAYAAANNPGGDARWRLYRPTDRASVLRVAAGMQLAGQAAGGQDAILHTDYFVLVDAQGQVRGIYHSTDEAAMARLTADATRLARQPVAPG